MKAKTKTAQKFFRGDVVKIKRGANASSTNAKGFTAVIVGSYFDQFAINDEGSSSGPDDKQTFTVINLKTGFPSSWFSENEMTRVGKKKVSEREIHRMIVRSLEPEKAHVC